MAMQSRAELGNVHSFFRQDSTISVCSCFGAYPSCDKVLLSSASNISMAVCAGCSPPSQQNTAAQFHRGSPSSAQYPQTPH